MGRWQPKVRRTAEQTFLPLLHHPKLTGFRLFHFAVQTICFFAMFGSKAHLK
jgi:hypothetical protein